MSTILKKRGSFHTFSIIFMNQKYKNNMKKKIEEHQLAVEPQNTLIFTCNLYQTVATIKINLTKVSTNIGSSLIEITPKKYFKKEPPSQSTAGKSNLKQQNSDYEPPQTTYHFELKTTNRQAYQVSQSKGQLKLPIDKPAALTSINVYLNDSTGLEKCLHDRFKLYIFLSKNGRIEQIYEDTLKVYILHAIDDIQQKSHQINDVISKSNENDTPSMISTPKNHSRHSQVTKMKVGGSIVKKSTIKNGKVEPDLERQNQKLEKDLAMTYDQIEMLNKRYLTIQKISATKMAKNRVKVYSFLASTGFCLIFGIIFGIIFPLDINLF